jgi:hypothetical protein
MVSDRSAGEYDHAITDRHDDCTMMSANTALIKQQWWRAGGEWNALGSPPPQNWPSPTPHLPHVLEYLLSACHVWTAFAHLRPHCMAEPVCAPVRGIR